MDYKDLLGFRIPLTTTTRVFKAEGFITDKNNILAMGSEGNGSYSTYDGSGIRMSKTFGDLKGVQKQDSFKYQVGKALSGFSPDKIIVDKHPDYVSTKLGEELAKQRGAELIRVQHHVAHNYAAAFENGLTDFVGISCDGTGYGEDGKVWGGEIFDGDKRVASLEEHSMIGGESAVRNPPRMLISILSKFLNEDELKSLMLEYFPIKDFNVLEKQLQQNFNCPMTSSCGRVLDAASALLKITMKRTYPGQPAIELEKASTVHINFEPQFSEQDGRKILLTTPLFEFLYKNRRKEHKGNLAATVHRYLSKGLLELASEYGKPIVFTGGVAYNRLISQYLFEKGVKFNNSVPPGDNGVSFGQIAYALNKEL